VLFGVDGAEDAGLIVIHAPVAVARISRNEDGVRILRCNLIENDVKCVAIVAVDGVGVARVPAEIPRSIDTSDIANVCIDEVGYRNQGDQRLRC
jgi:hypothetical protein